MKHEQTPHRKSSALWEREYGTNYGAETEEGGGTGRSRHPEKALDSHSDILENYCIYVCAHDSVHMWRPVLPSTFTWGLG